ncbi:uncharacterized protein M421DRAFT_89519 [Didymella exigua CBS 183.55]|uniref:DUF2985 domain-containing protein n=1 Tax=Didymella exigua CBS 183.55 TaxID=1150837 RepID=A0A6A5RYR6_9PLEO|nr:uncharacterized protein M421DRAFT_89519 [Didymella exigua CBS 183.55]KAF1932168.1 hypothetical protein M421DRAFT_89519 [Didymella exigua CBS 183.55]
MADQPPDDGQPLVSSTTSTTATSGPHTTTTTSYSGGHGASITHHGPISTTITHPTITTTTQMPRSPDRAPHSQTHISHEPQTHQYEPPTSSQQPQAPAPTAAPVARTRDSSIRIRRPSGQDVPLAQPAPATHPLQTIPQAQPTSDNSWQGQGNRRRSSSEPQRPSVAMLEAEHDLRRHPSAIPPHLQPVYEDASRAETNTGAGPPPARGNSKRKRPGMNRMSSAINLRRRDHQHLDHDIDNDMVDMLDVIDPEVSALTTLNNVQNSLFLPNLPWLYNRQPTYDLMQSPSDSSDEEMGTRPASRNDDLTQMTQPGEQEQASRGQLHRTDTLDSTLSTLEEGPGHHFAVLPHGTSLPGWTQEEKDALDDHVRHLLHSRRAKFKRSMRGFARYCRNPLGLLVTVYFFLITFWGAAWVLFLIGWISVAGRQAYFVEICDQILTALFCVVGITMFPFRLYDTYHMAFVAKYAHKTWRVRKERGLKKLKDHNELPVMPPQSTPYDTAEEIEEEVQIEAPVLNDEEQKKLEHHQGKLAKSHTFYRPHETYTHHAFSIRLLITIIVLLDCHSMFQIALGGTTWGIYYKVRPKALTAVILACSLTCNIVSGIIIGIGDKRSRKTLVVEQMMRQGLTEEALKKLRKERGLKARGLPTKAKKKQMQNEIGEKKKNPLDTILHRG